MVPVKARTDFLIDVMETCKPKGKFYGKCDDNFLAVDNSTGEAWTEEFETEQEARLYLSGFERSEIEEVMWLIEKPIGGTGFWEITDFSGYNFYRVSNMEFIIDGACNGWIKASVNLETMCDLVLGKKNLFAPASEKR